MQHLLWGMKVQELSIRRTLAQGSPGTCEEKEGALFWKGKNLAV